MTGRGFLGLQIVRFEGEVLAACQDQWGGRQQCHPPKALHCTDQTLPPTAVTQYLGELAPMPVALFHYPGMPNGWIHSLITKDLFSLMIRKSKKMLTSIRFESKFFKV
jgi:hypothetical protein